MARLQRNKSERNILVERLCITYMIVYATRKATNKVPYLDNRLSSTSAAMPQHIAAKKNGVTSIPLT